MEQFKLDAVDKIAHIEESLKSAHKRIDSIDSLTKSVYELASSIKTMQHDISDMSGRIRIIEEKPAKRWDIFVTAIISAVGSFVVGYFLKG